MFEQNIHNLSALQQSTLCRHLGRIDSIAWTRAEILKYEYLALDRELARRIKAAGKEHLDPSVRNLTPPQYLAQPPQTFIPESALVVFGD
jgi:hypothetical protein